MGDDYEYVSYKSPKTIVAETVYHFFRGGLYGAAFGLVRVRCEATSGMNLLFQSRLSNFSHII